MEDKDILQERYARHTKALFKGFLFVLEDLHQEHRIHFTKLKKALPHEHHDLIDQSNYFDMDKMQHLRKRVLDLGNDSLRGQNEDLDKFTVILDFKT